MRVHVVLLACALATMLAACASGPSGYPYAREPDPRRSEYIIAVADGLSIRVWGNTDLNTDTTVRPDGTITLPLVGDVNAAGKTPSQVKDSIAKALTAFIKSKGAVVTVAVTRTSYRVSVSGEVARPGVYESQHYLTVSEAMILAGGPSRFASSNETIIIRQDLDGQVRVIPIEYEELAKGLRPEQDLVLLNGDRIHVP